jgi:YegS/Rv2252/BmrU family lipid kinase
MARRRLLVIHNPTAGRRRRRLAGVLDALSRDGVAVDVAPTSHAGHATELAGQCNGYDAVIAAGGDGTINEVANGIDGRPLGVIPLGTANVLAIELRYPRGAEATAALLARGETRRVQPGRIAGRRFVQMASAGFDARVVARLDLGLKRWLGKGAYVLTGGRELLAGKHQPICLRLDGQAHEVGQVIIANGRYYGGRFVVAPAARPASPDFQVCLFLRSGPVALASYAGAIAIGRLAGRPDVRIATARELWLDGPAGEPVQIDGDPFGRLPGLVSVDPEPLWLIAP